MRRLRRGDCSRGARRFPRGRSASGGGARDHGTNGGCPRSIGRSGSGVRRIGSRPRRARSPGATEDGGGGAAALDHVGRRASDLAKRGQRGGSLQAQPEGHCGLGEAVEVGDSGGDCRGRGPVEKVGEGDSKSLREGGKITTAGYERVENLALACCQGRRDHSPIIRIMFGLSIGIFNFCLVSTQWSVSSLRGESMLPEPVVDGPARPLEGVKAGRKVNRLLVVGLKAGAPLHAGVPVPGPDTVGVARTGGP